MAIRAKSGRLKAGERKRRLKKGEPGAAFILDRRRAQRRVGKKKVRSRNGMVIDFAIIDELMLDFDVRKLVEMISLALAEHYRSSLLSGQKADGKGPLPDLREKSKDGTYGGRQGDFANKTGFMAEHWGLLKITGTSFKASRKIKPNGFDGRSFQINNWAKRRKSPVDLQSVDGDASAIIQDTINLWMEINRGSTVGTVRASNRQRGTLAELRNR